jgi:hypothetical protein
MGIPSENTLDDSFPMSRSDRQRDDISDAVNSIGNILLDLLIEVKGIRNELQIIKKGVEDGRAQPTV